MSSAIDIQIVSTANLEKIENFFKDASYRETIEFSANFNTRLCVERRLRLPFLDPQTGVAQNHSHLFVNKRQRMPGFRQGQIYTYPAARWRKSRRQYLNKLYKFPDRPFQALRKEQETVVANSNSITVVGRIASPTVASCVVNHDIDSNGALLEESSSLGAAGGDTSDSKDSQQQAQPIKEELSRDWFYDEIDMNDVDSLEDPKSPADDEYDYDPRYGSKKRRKRRQGKRSSSGDMLGGSNRRRTGSGRGRFPPESIAGLDSTDSVMNDLSLTPPPSSSRRLRGTGGRGRRRTKPKTSNSGNLCDPPSPGLTIEPPSFESAAAAVGAIDERKYL